MIQLAREELFRYAEAYQQLLKVRIKETLTAWCGIGTAESNARNHLCFDELQSFFEREEYQLDSTTIQTAEADERLEREMIGPLEKSRFLQQLSDKCESVVLNQVGEAVVSVLVELIVDVLWTNEKRMTDWGSLLLSKQVRMLQGFISKMSQPSADGAVAASAPNLIQAWERLSQIVHVLQLEKPSDWTIYQSTSVLSPGELERTLSLRVEFSNEAIQTVVSNASKAASTEIQKINQ